MKWCAISQTEMAASGGVAASTYLIRISAAWRIMEKFGELLNRRLEFHDEIDRAGSVLRNATPCAIKQVPPVSGQTTSHARKLRRVECGSRKVKRQLFFFGNCAVLRA